MPYEVLHILGSAQPAGRSFTRIVAGLASGLDFQRYRLHAWFLRGDGPLTAELEVAGVEVRVVQWDGIRRDIAGAWRFWHYLRGHDYAIIHQHSGGRSVPWLARAASRARIVLHLHGRVLEERDPHPVTRRVRDADAVIATSHAVATFVVGSRPQVVYPGVRVREKSNTNFNRTEPRRNIIGTACRLVSIKGIVYLIRAIGLLRVEFSDLCLEIAGVGPEQACLEQEVQLLGLEAQVTFFGWQEDVEALLSRWDIFAMPSLEEGFGMAALEAMAAGLPVVATAVGGVPELVEDGKTGWLVPPEHPAALADRLRVLLVNSELRRTMGAAGRARAREHFSMEQMVAGIAKIYDDLLGLSINR